ncbi:MAG: phosphoribosylformylglycinamidine synthase I [Chloroflexi bacterium AL-W]|nr:phosphoribosylformylglycinamidine synthase I [Chloroflexi bacterium AL-N1]NOK68964.1 phosphoribosylformylglycinamidine synthase I [Chloroflexi bacterium AL-N10]NOK76947.1 phosphoribosylformylglycinamidine synthase I [Chloroflexi bacterium AL-N5]NOK82665.1 phosphoribosylformylglycinamidine synthase I [Chloroflexi bacterium AL-W]NOK90804.1 phosphoribosylformylglycinamidine synthase I [Chloroflexi bacterium AL-N15]
MKPRTLILRAPGINRDEDAAAAVALAGGLPERVHVNQIVDGAVQLTDYAMLIIPGGFSYGDHLGAGKLLAIDLAYRLADQLHAFVADRRPVLGICNGFQVLVKAGILPGETDAAPPEYSLQAKPDSVSTTSVTLTDNLSAQFECRWVYLAAEPTSPCVFTQGLHEPIQVPVAHGEGRFVAKDQQALEALHAHKQVALRYVTASGNVPAYPDNPNGSDAHIAGICNATGTVLGLMPHPENAMLPTQHPRWSRERWRTSGDGLVIFQNAVRYAAQL